MKLILNGKNVTKLFESLATEPAWLGLLPALAKNTNTRKGPIDQLIKHIWNLEALDDYTNIRELADSVEELSKAHRLDFRNLFRAFHLTVVDFLEHNYLPMALTEDTAWKVFKCLAFRDDLRGLVINQVHHPETNKDTGLVKKSQWRGKRGKHARALHFLNNKRTDKEEKRRAAQENLDKLRRVLEVAPDPAPLVVVPPASPNPPTPPRHQEPAASPSAASNVSPSAASTASRTSVLEAPESPSSSNDDAPLCFQESDSPSVAPRSPAPPAVEDVAPAPKRKRTVYGTANQLRLARNRKANLLWEGL